MDSEAQEELAYPFTPSPYSVLVQVQVSAAQEPSVAQAALVLELVLELEDMAMATISAVQEDLVPDLALATVMTVAA